MPITIAIVTAYAAYLATNAATAAAAKSNSNDENNDDDTPTITPRDIVNYETIDLLPHEIELSFLELPITTISYFEGACYSTIVHHLYQRIGDIITMNPWVAGYLVNGDVVAPNATAAATETNNDINPNDDVKIVYDPANGNNACSNTRFDPERSGHLRIFKPGEIPDMVSLFSADDASDDASSSYTKLCSQLITAGTVLRNNVDLINKRTPLWRVSLIPAVAPASGADPSSSQSQPPQRFALVVSMSHALGDVHTYYKLYPMLGCSSGSSDGNNHDDVTRLNPFRKIKYDEALEAKLVGGDGTSQEAAAAAATVTAVAVRNRRRQDHLSNKLRETRKLRQSTAMMMKQVEEEDPLLTDKGVVASGGIEVSLDRVILEDDGQQETTAAVAAAATTAPSANEMTRSSTPPPSTTTTAAAEPHPAFSATTLTTTATRGDDGKNTHNTTNNDNNNQQQPQHQEERRMVFKMFFIDEDWLERNKQNVSAGGDYDVKKVTTAPAASAAAGARKMKYRRGSVFDPDNLILPTTQTMSTPATQQQTPPPSNDNEDTTTTTTTMITANAVLASWLFNLTSAQHAYMPINMRNRLSASCRVYGTDAGNYTHPLLIDDVAGYATPHAIQQSILSLGSSRRSSSDIVNDGAATTTTADGNDCDKKKVATVSIVLSWANYFRQGLSFHSSKKNNNADTAARPSSPPPSIRQLYHLPVYDVSLLQSILDTRATRRHLQISLLNTFTATPEIIGSGEQQPQQQQRRRAGAFLICQRDMWEQHIKHCGIVQEMIC